LLLYPIWWALGLGVLISDSGRTVAVSLLGPGRRAAARRPPGFLLWLLFLPCRGEHRSARREPAGHVPGTVAGRLLSVGFRLVEYGSLTILLLYAGNLARAELSQRRLAWLLSWLLPDHCGGRSAWVLAASSSSPPRSTAAAAPHPVQQLRPVAVHPAAPS